jgi:hypothetical protein
MRIKTQAKLVLFSICSALLCLAIAKAQSAGNATIKKFKALEYFEPPHELQVKSYLEGAEAEPKGDGLILLRDAKLQTYKEDGAPEMTITTPQCLFNRNNRTVNSAGPFHMRTSDDALFQEGVGFFWQRTNSEFIISNRVQTTVKWKLVVSEYAN